MEPETYVHKNYHEDDPQQTGITYAGLMAEIRCQDKWIDIPLAEVNRQRNLPANSLDHVGAFLMRTANDWIEESRKQPNLKQLFDLFWCEGEICILFASSNQGKSILAVQIAESISLGKPIPGFTLEASAQLVLYFDFEMSKKQFAARYTDKEVKYEFSSNFRRCEPDPDMEMPSQYRCYEDYVVDSIEQNIIQTGSKVLIIDNLTYLSTDTETAKNAAPLMKKLKALKEKHGLSVLILAHTPKRDASKPLSQDDLQGSSRLMQFCDSSFAIGASILGSDTKYFKQVKVRSAAHEYDGENVVICRIVKPEGFLQFERVSNSSEHEHLRSMTREDKAELVAKVKELSDQGKPQRAIADELGISTTSVNRYLKKSQTL